MKVSDIDLIKQGRDPFLHGPGAVGGKSSVSKRHSKKHKKEVEEDADEISSD